MEAGNIDLISQQTSVYKDYLKMMSLGLTHSVLCYSSGGLGKTYTTIEILKNLGVSYRYINGVATAVELYKNLYDYNGKFLIIDDVETLFQDDRIMNLLKASLWEVDGKRVVSYRTSSMVLEGYPETFEYTGKIIILANELKGRFDESHRALFSRCLVFELIYSFEDIIKMSLRILEKEKDLSAEQRKLVRTLLLERVSPEHNFNFRLLNRLISFVKYDINKAEELFMNSIEVDEDIEIINKLYNSNMPIMNQIEEYKKYTGNSKATFFRRKKQLIKKKVISKLNFKNMDVKDNNKDKKSFSKSFNDIK